MDLFSTSQEVKSDDFQFNLKRDLVFFDIESTGLNVVRDRIVQIALIKYPKNGGDPVEMEMMINPGIPISQEAIDVHGITPDMLKNKPTFAQVGQKIIDFIGDSDLSGYNSDRFDVPILMEELSRMGIVLDMTKRKSIDVQKIFYKMEPRTLKAAYKMYCQEELKNAHDALADVRATAAVLKGQIQKYDGVDYYDGDGIKTEAPIKNDMSAIHEFTADFSVVDVTMRLKKNKEGEIIFNFGKYINQPVVEVLKKDYNYYQWILNKDFSSQVKQIVKNLMKPYGKQYDNQ
ncbi:MAG: 3'-5' exonuclease [Saprospiraceae bacterium]|nr:3'-5' exonuclease [Saprospiraceae bacterium]